MIHIALNIDDHYVQHCSVLMASVCQNNNPENIHFHILSIGLQKSNVTILERLSKKFLACISFYVVNKEKLESLPTTEKWSHSIYLRLLIPQMLDSRISRVLYLDCDMIVRGKLDELWNTDLTGKAAAVVEDLHFFNAPMIERLGYDPYESYFNSGMLLMNLDYFRENHCVDKIFAYMKSNLSMLIHPDQDALNAVLHGQCVFVHCRWNYHYRFHVSYLYPEIFLSRDLNRLAKRNPVILHFSERKPWNMNCDSPFKDEYFKYLQDTEFNKYKVPIDWGYLLKIKMKQIYKLLR
jgi:lipopolysaccharide biosynthesis glycosyltransferase